MTEFTLSNHWKQLLKKRKRRLKPGELGDRMKRRIERLSHIKTARLPHIKTWFGFKHRNFTLIVGNGKHGEWSLKDPSTSIIKLVIENLIPAKGYYAVLQSNSQINNCAYIQTRVLEGGERLGQYLIETRYIFGDRFCHYKTYSKYSYKAKELFADFIYGNVPNTAGWIDITEAMIIDRKKRIAANLRRQKRELKKLEEQ